MNEKFLEQPKEKQLRIINAAMEVFSKNEYKRASTEEMAAKAGISKGLLFYYFHNKKSLYLFLFRYAEALLKEKIVNETYHSISDFFELMAYLIEEKAQILAETPYLMDFSLQAFYCQKEEVSKELDDYIDEAYHSMDQDYLKHIDLSKFKEGVSPQEILTMLLWLGDGYFHEKQRTNEPVAWPELKAACNRWCEMFRSISYKEEYLDGNDKN